MAATATVSTKAREMTQKALVHGIVAERSPYMALVLCEKIGAVSLVHLLSVVRLPENGHRKDVFNACADGYAVYADARDRGLL